MINTGCCIRIASALFYLDFPQKNRGECKKRERNTSMLAVKLSNFLSRVRLIQNTDKRIERGRMKKLSLRGFFFSSFSFSKGYLSGKTKEAEEKMQKFQ